MTKMLTCVRRVYVRRIDNYEKVLEKRFFSLEKATQFMSWCMENIKNVDVGFVSDFCEDTITISDDE